MTDHLNEARPQANGTTGADTATHDNVGAKARTAARQTAQAVEANPISAVVGGLAVGAIAAAVIPRSAREKELLAPVGRRVSAAAVAAIAAAKEAGRNELEARGLTPDAAKEQARSVAKEFAKAAGNAGKAAADAGREQVKGA